MKKIIVFFLIFVFVHSVFAIDVNNFILEEDFGEIKFWETTQESNSVEGLYYVDAGKQRPYIYENYQYAANPFLATQETTCTYYLSVSSTVDEQASLRANKADKNYCRLVSKNSQFAYACGNPVVSMYWYDDSNYISMWYSSQAGNGCIRDQPSIMDMGIAHLSKQKSDLTIETISNGIDILEEGEDPLYVVYGAEDQKSATQIATFFPNRDVNIVDVLLDDNQDVIIVGGPCANDLWGVYGETICDEWEHSAGKGVVKAVLKEDQIILLVSGTTKEDTSSLVNVILDHRNHDFFRFSMEEVITLNSVG